MKRFLVIIMVCVLCMNTLAACGLISPKNSITTEQSTTAPEDPGNNPEPARKYIYGLGEPLISSNVNAFNTEKSIDLAGALGAKSFRMWFLASDIFTGFSYSKVTTDAMISSISKNTVAYFNEVFDRMKEVGIEEITGMAHILPVTESTKPSNQHYVPHFDSPDYQIFLDKTELMWKTLASTFPQITIWEVGNETNHSFMEYADREMTYLERAKVTIDIMYYANRGIKAGNPNAMTITPGFAPVTSYLLEDGTKVTENNGIDSITYFMELIYANIASGKFPTGLQADTNPDNYFQGVAWHPYDLGKYPYANTNDPKEGKFDINLWIDANNRCYEVMKNNGDGDKEVWFTEFGLTSKKDSLFQTTADDMDHKIYHVDGKYYKTTDDYENIQAEFVRAYFDAMESDKMHYVHACHFFRLYGCTVDYSWNGFTVLYYGMFFEADERLGRGFYPRQKAYVIQEIYGGTGDLMQFATWEAASSTNN